MSAKNPTAAERGRSVLIYKAALLYDDGNDPIAGEGGAKDFRDLGEAIKWARRELHNAAAYENGWYASIERGHYIDTVGDGLPDDFEFEQDPEWSHTERLTPASERKDRP